jgi:hypothetical protein
VRRLTDRDVQVKAAEVAYRREIWRGRIVIVVGLSLAGMVAAALVWVAPHIHNCAYALFDPALRGKSYVCADPDPGWFNDGD